MVPLLDQGWPLGFRVAPKLRSAPGYLLRGLHKLCTFSKTHVSHLSKRSKVSLLAQPGRYVAKRTLAAPAVLRLALLC